MVAILALFLDLLDDRHDFPDAAFIRMPVRADVFVIITAVLTPAAPVKLERRVAGIHHAIRANLVFSEAHFIQNVRENGQDGGRNW